MNFQIAAQRRQTGQAWYFSILVLLSLGLLLFFPRLSFPVATAYVLALVLKPARDFFVSLPKKYKFVATIGVIGVLALTIWPIVTLTSMVGAEASDLSVNLPRLEYLLREKFVDFRDFLFMNFKIRLDMDPIELIAKKFRKDGGKWIGDVPKIMGNMLEWLMLTPVFTWFFLTEGQRLKQAFLHLVPNLWFERTYMLLHQFNGRFGGYIVAKTIEASILGVLLMIGLWCIGYPYAFLLGLIGGISNVVPYVGPLLGWGAALLVGILQPYGHGSLVAMTVVYVIGNLIDMALVFPLLVSKIVNLHPLVVVASVILGSEVGGLVGMIVSVPAATFIKLVLEDVHKSLYVEKPR